jgi:hypothetical protein
VTTRPIYRILICSAVQSYEGTGRVVPSVLAFLSLASRRFFPDYLANSHSNSSGRVRKSY